MTTTRRTSITAIDSERLPSVLRKLGLYDEVVGGRAKCFVCGRQLSLDSIGGIMGVDGKPVLVCDSYSCIAKASAMTNRKLRA